MMCVLMFVALREIGFDIVCNRCCVLFLVLTMGEMSRVWEADSFTVGEGKRYTLYGPVQDSVKTQAIV